MGALSFSVGGVPFTGRVLVRFLDGRLESGEVVFSDIDRAVTAAELERVVKATHGAEGTRVATPTGTAVLDIGVVAYDAGSGKITGFDDVRLLRWEPVEAEAASPPRPRALRAA